ncbi:CapA family protein [Salipaludibacillus sp. CUR1]|uniref:CapA family protein n=1 Tax=Salipaludibacillus sp. CUR1 TaxID=2820003 RepID=UPI001E56F630|nr:CapA family protein [Salipaludibacillus sp. CUR1]MCE7791763.1 CapA family protein [Salipaludibacillus sp. CUR1]
MSYKLVLLFSFTIVLAGGIIFLAGNEFEGEERISAAAGERSYELMEKQGDMKRPFVKEVKIGALGDVLLHENVYDDAETDDGYDFSPMLTHIKEHLHDLDFVMANQESMPGGTEIGLSSYPLFNSPRQIVDDLQNAGVDLLSLANNHSLDAGLEGLYSAIDHLNKTGMPYTGIFESPEDREEDRIINVQGIDIGVLAYTYGLNGIPVPEGHEYAVSLLDNPHIDEEINQLRERSDVVVVHAHWGDEYERMPNDDQRRMAQEFTDAGADIIIGHHPHVLQPIDWLEDEDGRQAVVFYSLGNFLSGQVFEYTDIGGIGRITVRKVREGDSTSIELAKPDILPTFVQHEDHDNYRVLLLEDAYEKEHIDKSHQKITAHVNQKIEND